jgi:lysophospholipase L1-like esterase
MRVLVFGASSTQGYWDSEGGWADRLKHYYDELQIRNFSIEQPKIMNLGISGDTSGQVLERIAPEAQARQNAKGISIVVQVGSNNAAEENGQTRSTPEEYQAELEQIIAKAKQLTDKVLIVGFPAVNESKTNPIPWADLYYKNENISKFEDAARVSAGKLDVPFVPVYKKFKQQMDAGTEMNAHDGLHPNNEGHRLIFELVRPALDQLLNT